MASLRIVRILSIVISQVGERSFIIARIRQRRKCSPATSTLGMVLTKLIKDFCYCAFVAVFCVIFVLQQFSKLSRQGEPGIEFFIVIFV